LVSIFGGQYLVYCRYLTSCWRVCSVYCPHLCGAADVQQLLNRELQLGPEVPGGGGVTSGKQGFCFLGSTQREDKLRGKLYLILLQCCFVFTQVRLTTALTASNSAQHITARFPASYIVHSYLHITPKAPPRFEPEEPLRPDTPRDTVRRGQCSSLTHSARPCPASGRWSCSWRRLRSRGPWPTGGSAATAAPWGRG
jgi:hypothetical protein